MNFIKKLTKFKKNHYCNICKTKVRYFLPYKKGDKSRSQFIKQLDIIGSDVENFTCPHCYCHDRERHLMMYFDTLELWKKFNNKKILHLAPENNISKKILECSCKEYVRGDLYPATQSIEKLDICSLTFDTDYFDFIICNHVLEHVQDDMKAMNELLRVLSKKGMAILQTPYSNFLSKTFVDESIDSDELREKYYGQKDHVRVFGLDLFQKLKTVGFKLNIKEHKEQLSNYSASYYGVNERENLILVKK